MISRFLILEAIAPVFLVIAIGFALRRGRILSDAADENLMRLIITVLYPALMLHYVLGNPVLNTPENVFIPPLVGGGTVLLGFLVAWLLAPVFGIRVGGGRRTFSFTNGVYNYGYIPIPIVLALFPGEQTVGVLLVHNLGVELVFWTVGLLIVTGAFSRDSWKHIFNPPVVALVAALILNGIGWGGAVPPFASRTIEFLAVCAIPLGLLLAGSTLADLAPDMRFRARPVVPLAACLVRLLLLPLLFLALALLIPESMIELRRVIVVQAAMPAGLFSLVIARHYGGDARVAVQVILATTLCSLVTIPLWTQFGLWLLELTP